MSFDLSALLAELDARGQAFGLLQSVRYMTQELEKRDPHDPLVAYGKAVLDTSTARRLAAWHRKYALAAHLTNHLISQILEVIRTTADKAFIPNFLAVPEFVQRISDLKALLESLPYEAEEGHGDN